VGPEGRIVSLRNITRELLARFVGASSTTSHLAGEPRTASRGSASTAEASPGHYGRKSMPWAAAAGPWRSTRVMAPVSGFSSPK
jgi:hypothetical protein